MQIRIRHLVSLALTLAALPIVGCEKKAHVNAISACMIPDDCTINLSSPDGVSRELRCEGPKTKPNLTCTCVENKVLGKKVQITQYPTDLTSALPIVTTACQW